MKKILLFTLLFLLTGCDVQYNLTITNKEEVRESFKIYVDNDKILSTYSSTGEYLDYYSNLYLENDGYKDFNISTKESNPQSYFNVKRNYDSLDNYIESLSFKSMFEAATIERVGKYVTFTTTRNAYLESIKKGEVVSLENQYDSFKISIKFYNEVTDSNAEEIDEKNNIYTWIVSEESKEDYIYFKIGPKVKYNIMFKDYIQNNLVSIIIVISTIAILTITMLFIYLKSKKNNEV